MDVNLGAYQEKSKGIDTFFSALEARQDRWRELGASSRSWAADAKGRGAEAHAHIQSLFAEIVPMEAFWAYPGPTLMRSLSEALAAQDAGVFASLAQKIGRALSSGSYRHDAGAWDPLKDGAGDMGDALLPDEQDAAPSKPYFEVLIVTPNSRRR
jgi:arginine decarboxylase